MIILIAAYLILCCILFHATENFTLLESMVLSVASLFLASFILVEVLSLWNLLNSTLISLCWIVSNVALLLIALKVHICFISYHNHFRNGCTVSDNKYRLAHLSPLTGDVLDSK
jgi:hypothetical protein